MSDEPVNIDRDKLRAAIRRLGPECVFYMLDDAIDLKWRVGWRQRVGKERRDLFLAHRLPVVSTRDPCHGLSKGALPSLGRK